jgi:hypothetical protein
MFQCSFSLSSKGWRQYATPKLWPQFTRLHDSISQKTEMREACSSRMLVPTYQTTRCNMYILHIRLHAYYKMHDFIMNRGFHSTSYFTSVSTLPLIAFYTQQRLTDSNCFGCFYGRGHSPRRFKATLGGFGRHSQQKAHERL